MPFAPRQLALDAYAGFEIANLRFRRGLASGVIVQREQKTGRQAKQSWNLHVFSHNHPYFL
jgi:hypothetical protein